MRIVNETNLPYKILGKWIDALKKSRHILTMYYERFDTYKTKYKGKTYGIDVTYLKKYEKWRFYEMRGQK